MKRDFNVIRQIMMEIEKCGDSTGLGELEIPDLDTATITYHLRLLYQAGLVQGIDVSNHSTPFNLLNMNLTWEGHDFLDSARNNTLWKKVQKKIGDTVGSVSIEVLKSLLVRESMQQVGLIP